jgi:collagenase-like PrtC family protease
MWDSFKLEARDKTIDYCKNVAKRKTNEILKKWKRNENIL